MTRCSRCGNDNPDHILYCGFCSAPLRSFSGYGGTSQAQYPGESITRPQSLINDQTRVPILLMVIAVVMAIAGGVVYSAAWASAFNEVGDFGNDPFNSDFSDFNAAMAMMFAAYAIWAFSGVLFVGGLILLVMKSM